MHFLLKLEKRNLNTANTENTGFALDLQLGEAFAVISVFAVFNSYFRFNLLHLSNQANKASIFYPSAGQSPLQF